MTVERGSISGLRADRDGIGDIVLTPVSVPLAEDLFVRSAGLGKPQFTVPEGNLNVSEASKVGARQASGLPPKDIQAAQP